MNELTAILLFLLGVGLMSYASYDLTNRFERLGNYFHLSGAFLGVITAIGADAPEISTAFVALFSGNHDVGLGVVFGSNIFNLAGLLGLSALLAGKVEAKPQGLLFNGGYSTLLILLIVAMTYRLIPLVLGILIVLGVVLIYLYLCLLSPEKIKRLPLPAKLQTFIIHATASESDDKPTNLVKSDFIWVIVGIVLVIAASTMTVKSAIFLATEWQISQVIVGVLVLSVLTSLPNVIAAVKMTFERKYSAVVSEAFNSNNINLIGGVCLPFVVFGLPALSTGLSLTIFWYLLMNIAIVWIGCRSGGIQRGFGGVIFLFYLIFAAAVMFYHAG